MQSLTYRKTIYNNKSNISIIMIKKKTVEKNGLIEKKYKIFVIQEQSVNKSHKSLPLLRLKSLFFLSYHHFF